MKRAAFLLAALVIAPRVTAQTFEIVHAFGAPAGDPEAALISGADGRLYGTARTGGFFGLGSVFALAPDGSGGWTFTELHAFAGADGAAPTGPLIQAFDGGFYGTTSAGGDAGLGTVFLMTASGHVTTLHAFTGIGDDGANPAGGLLQAPDGSFFGTTVNGGAGGLGTVFRIDAAGNTVTFRSFAGYSSGDGSRPYGGVIAGGDGRFYGTTSEGGSGNQGTIFRLDAAGDVEIVASFSGGNGAYPQAPLVRATNGYFYGTAPLGGTTDSGTVFRVSYLGGLTLVHSFGYGEPTAPLIQATDGRLYGTTLGAGLVFRLDTSGDNFEVIHAISDNGNFGYPGSGLLELPDGRFGAGVTIGGQSELYAIDAQGHVATLYAFTATEGMSPWGGLIEATDGNLYGTTAYGGVGANAQSGSVFRMGLDGALTTIHTFDGTDGSNPLTRLLQPSDGFLYGTTGTQSARFGSVFRCGTDGSFADLYEFHYDDGATPDGLIEGSDGAFYGVTEFGGDDGVGTIFRIDSAGSLTSLHSFSSDDGAQPRGSLVLSSGSFFGVTAGGGASGQGTVFGLNAASGVLSTRWSFDGSQGGPAGPLAGLVKASDGKFYGATSGFLYRFDGTGTVSTLHTLTEDEGLVPVGTLIQGSDGKLYGTAEEGGSHGLGTVFRVDLLGSLEKLHDFSGPDGTSPQSELFQASNGSLYGVAPLGGPARAGVVYRLSPAATEPSLSAIVPTSGRSAGGTAFALAGQHLQPGAAISIGAVAAPGVLDVDATQMRAISPVLDAGTLNDVVVTNPDASAATLPGAWFSDFLDVPSVSPFHDSVETVFRSGITAGCGAGNYCPGATVTRAQMAVLLLKAEHGSAYAPPACTGVFDDVACPGGFAVDWIEQLATEGITGGCGGGDYCPAAPVTRAQMAVFLLKTEHGSAYVPPGCAGVFDDVTCPSLFADWIERLYAEGVTAGCRTDPLDYCPGSSVTRGQMSVFLVKTFGLP